MKTTKIVAFLLALALTGSAYAHCEIPCGIYDDAARITEMREHVGTIEKAMNQVTELSAASETNHNQLVRWVMNKEDHADKLQEIATQYFMFQRIKPADEADAAAWAKYQSQLTLTHKITVFAMKAKQSTALGHVETLRVLLDEFEKAYFDHEH
jgi:nickel superoxide dismutase